MSQKNVKEPVGLTSLSPSQLSFVPRQKSAARARRAAAVSHLIALERLDNRLDEADRLIAARRPSKHKSHIHLTSTRKRHSHWQALQR